MKKFIPVLAVTGLLIAACDRTSTPNPADLKLAGTVVEPVMPTDPSNYTLTTKAWTGGAGKVTGYVSAGTQQLEVATGTVAADGTMAMTLPATVDLSSVTTPLIDPTKPIDGELTGITCTGNLSGWNSPVKMAQLSVVVTAAKTGPITPTEMNSISKDATGAVISSFKGGTYIYADGATNVKGTQTCQGTINGVPLKTTTYLDLAIMKGWNKVSNEFKMTMGSTQTMEATIKTGSFPMDKWVYVGTP